MLPITNHGDPCKPTLLFIHGFLGNKENWDPIIHELKKEFHCITIDLPKYNHLHPLRMIQNTIHSFQKPIRGGIGYSLGGRILLQLELSIPCILFSSHPGLSFEKEKQQRHITESLWMNRLKNDSMEHFLHQWYQQPLFSSFITHPRFHSIFNERLQHSNKDLLFIYESFLLSKQKSFDHLSENFTFFYGEYDSYYKELYLSKKWHARVEKIPQSGHAVIFENPNECARSIERCMKHYL